MRPAPLLLCALLAPSLAPSLAWAAAAPARGQQAVVRAEGQAETLDCRGGDARVEGNRNRLTFRGACRQLELFGDGNAVQAELASGARVRVEGQNNRVGYTTARGGQPPVVSVAGVNSLVAPSADQAQPAPTLPAPPPASPPPPPTAPLASPAPLTRHEPSRAEPVQPEPPHPAAHANQPAPTTRPEAPSASPPSASAPAALPPAPSPAPSPAPAAAPQPAPQPAEQQGPLAIRGDDQQREADCAGRDAVIEGNRGSYLLRGGCRSLRVTGALATVRAELQPGARIQIDGSGVVVHWRLTAPGSPPLVAIRGEGNRAVRAGPRGY